MTTNNQIDISNQVISMYKEYVTREGKKVRILCTDNYANPMYPVVAIIADGDIYSFAQNGKYIEIDGVNDLDLIDIETYNKSQFNQGDILIVGVYGIIINYMRVFSHFDGYGHCCCFDSGMQSGNVVAWDYYRKATEIEIATALQSFDHTKVI